MNPYKDILPYKMLKESARGAGRNEPRNFTRTTIVTGNAVADAVFERGIFWTHLPEPLKNIVKSWMSWRGVCPVYATNILKWYVGQWVEAQWYAPEGWEKKLDDENCIPAFCEWLKHFHIKPF